MSKSRKDFELHTIRKLNNHNLSIMGGTQTLEQAEAMKKRFEIDDRKNPWTRGTTRFEIREVSAK